MFYEIYGPLSAFSRYGERFINLLARDSDGDANHSADEEILSIRLIENEGSVSNIERLIEALSAINGLYKVCAELEGGDYAHLKVISCDSGSDKMLLLKGSVAVIQACKGVFISTWDRLVFHRENQTTHRLKNIADSLPILEKIHQLQQNNSISNENAELLRHNVIGYVTKIVECGIVIPEIEEHSSFNPRLLLAPEKKLIAAGAIIDAPSNSTSADEAKNKPKTKPRRKLSIEDQIDDMSEDELKNLIKENLRQKKQK